MNRRGTMHLPARLGIGALLAALLAAGPLAAAPPKELLAEAQRLLDAGDNTAAVAKYEEARSLAPDSAEIAYNLGVAKYRLGDFTEAANLFKEAASKAKADLAARAMFNQGTATYADALKHVPPTGGATPSMPAPTPGGEHPALSAEGLDEAIQAVEQSITHFRDAANANPADADSRANAERAFRLLKKLEEMKLEQQQQQQQQQQDNKDQKDQQEKQDQQQQNQSQQNQDQQNQDQQKQQKQDQKQGQDQQQQEQQDQKSQSQSQKDQSQKGQDQKGQDQQRPDQQKPDQKKPDQQKQQSPDQKDQQDRDQGQQSSAPKEQNDQKGEQRKPTDGGQLDQQKPDPNAKQEPQPAGASDQRPTMTPQEAQQILQMVRDKEKQRREAILRQQRAKQTPVNKDW